jgi:hypothetical protein
MKSEGQMAGKKNCMKQPGVNDKNTWEYTGTDDWKYQKNYYKSNV